MKTLDQVQPRTPVDSTNTPGDASNKFIINTPGSYYLTGNVVGVSAKHGISIQADNVTLDLNGFAVRITGSTTMNGIDVPSPQANIIVRNGVIRNWKNGVNAPSATSSRYENLNVASNSGVGLSLSAGVLVKDCVVTNNGGDGIDVGSDATVIDCVSRLNSGNGIVLAGAGLVNHCVADACGFAGILVSATQANINSCEISGNSVGISSTWEGVTVTGCDVSANAGSGIVFSGVGCRVSGCVISHNNGNGVQLGTQSTIEKCTVTFSSGDGIVLTSADDCLENNVSANGVDGIHAPSSNNNGFGNRIEGNHIRDNAEDGIFLEQNNAHNVVVRNTAGNNHAGNYALGTGNGVGPIISADAGNVGNATNSPLANIQD